MKALSSQRRAHAVRLTRTHPGVALVRPAAAPAGVAIGLVGAGKGGAALLDLLLEWADGSVAVVVDLRPDAPGLRKARALGIPTARHHLAVFSHPVDVVLEVTGRAQVLDDLVRAKPAHVEVIGAPSLRFFWTLLQRQVTVLQESRARQEILMRLTGELTQLQPVEPLLGHIAEACGRLLRTDSTGFRLIDGDELVVVGTTGDARQIMSTARVKIGESLVGLVAATGAPLIVRDPADDLRMIPAHREATRAAGHRAFLGVPVKVGDRVVGVLSIWTRRREGFSADDVAIATTFASQAAVALENSRLYHESQRAYEKLSQTQEQLTQAQKMEAVGRLAGGIAHDFNNLLTVIMGRSDLLRRDPAAADSVRRGLEIIHKTAGTAADLTRQLLAFSRKQVLQPRVLDLNAVVSNTNQMLRRLIGEHIALLTVLDPALGCVKADPGQIDQILMNLAINARDAMSEGGRLTIETANVELDTAYVRGHVDVRPGPHVMLAVSDTGVGMTRETQTRLFEPFFTTKEAGKGTGLGLSTVYGIVKQSGGYVWVYSEPGEGATFKIYFPRVQVAAEPSETTTIPPADAARRSETILLVEDEDEVRELAREVLQARGYTVLEAPDGAEALRISERHHGTIHLMLTDIVMPGMSGRELATRLTALRPWIAVLYMSGYTDNAVVHHGVLDPGVAFVQKPMAPDVLVRKVRELLDQDKSLENRECPDAGLPRREQTI